MKNWTIHLGPVEGKKGQTLVVAETTEVFFKGRALLLAKGSARPCQMTVGAKLVFGINEQPPQFRDPAPDGTLFTEPVDCPVAWPGNKIAFVVKFEKDGVFDATIFGDGKSAEEVFPQVAKLFG